MAAGLEAVLRRDRRVVAGSLALVALLAWSWLLAGAGMDMDALVPAPWTLGYAALNFFMWWIMMVAMMLPSAAPTVLLAAALNRKAEPGRAPYGASSWFTAGYLAAWALFSLVAVAAQWTLAASGLLSPAMSATSPILAGALLIVAGLWQLTPAKRTCLAHCRSPVHLLTRKRRPGNLGSLVVGAEHGAFCLACCWFLMALLFVGGVMNLFWIVGLALYVLGEKLLPAGQRLGRLAGAGLVVAGVGLLVGWR
jgi:predicted metal-binding membrane protein